MSWPRPTMAPSRMPGMRRSSEPHRWQPRTSPITAIHRGERQSSCLQGRGLERQGLCERGLGGHAFDDGVDLEPALQTDRDKASFDETRQAVLRRAAAPAVLLERLEDGLLR